MSSLSGGHSLGGDPLCCNGNQEKRPLLRGEGPQAAANSTISRRETSPDGTTAIIQIPLPAPERVELRYQPEKWKTLIAFLFSSLCLFSNLFVLAWVHERVPDRDKVPPLPDVFFSLFPAIDQALKVSEVIIIASVWTCILLMVLHRYRWIVFRRVFIIIGALYAMRAITMLVTQVPVASTTYYCSPKANSTSPLIILKRVLQLFSGFGLSINGQHTYCGDYIFSGHTLILTLCYLIIKEYSPQRCRILHILYFCISFFGVFCILLSRGHYSIDVILGYYVTTRVFWIYHSLCASQLSSKVSRIDQRSNQRAPSDGVWCCLIPFVKKSRPPDSHRDDDDDGNRTPELGDRHSYQANSDTRSTVSADAESARNNNNEIDQRSHALDSLSERDEAHGSSLSAVSYLSRVWWYPLFRFAEQNVTGPVPRQYEWPLPWPRKWLPRTRIS